MEVEEIIMSNIYTSADQLIGKTPLLELVHIEKEEGLEARVLGKLEYFNPAGSVKDRIAKAMIDDAEEEAQWKAEMRERARERFNRLTAWIPKKK